MKGRGSLERKALRVVETALYFQGKTSMTIPREELASISALARIYNRDRRTVARLVADIEPVKVEGEGRFAVRYFRVADVEPLLVADSAFDRLHRARADLLELKRSVRQKRAILADRFQHLAHARVGIARGVVLHAPSKWADTVTTILRSGGSAKKVRDLLADDLAQIREELCRPLVSHGR